ncbi:unnamed protein product [Spirodela intermedia]|uniref:TPX2 C-terminal domain-containing protein n=1 Tax=Spirodela intermedia TaxID=51605 RepID=A0A7I8IHQ0_SPIIN|nr:unnamed protein product [Spirodela intermedia]CAA6657411.1 unnamed protein product [Spirodela intermedia]
MAPLHSVLGSPGMKTPSKKPLASRPPTSEICRMSENCDPNLTGQSSSHKSIASPANRSAKTKKSAAKLPSSVVSPPTAVRERKFFIVSKKKITSGDKGGDPMRCRQAAYEALRASQENFFRRDHGAASTGTTEISSVEDTKRQEEEDELNNNVVNDDEGSVAYEHLAPANDSSHQDLEGSSKVRKMRSLMMEEAMSTMPEAGSGRVLHLVKAFEKSTRKVMNWPLPGLHPPPKPVETRASSSSVEFFFPPKDFDRESKMYSSFDSNDGRLSLESKASEGGRRSRRNSSDSLKSSWNKKLKVTRQNPFKLRTEQRGRLKEEYFFNKVKEMLTEEDKKRIPIAQGLPWTTDEPECLVKPPVKEITEPVDLILHSDVRAAERAAFDTFVAERLTVAERTKLERERQRKLEEEEEIKKLRKELVPRAQPMPYFDRPFIPKKSTRPQTVPKEPRFRVRPHRPW